MPTLHRRRHSSSESPSLSDHRSIRRLRRYSVQRPKRKITKKVATAYVVKSAMKFARKLNPNDSNPFVWIEKIKRDLSHGRIILGEFSREEAEKRKREGMDVIEKNRKRNEKVAQPARARADYEKEEEEFEFNQSKIRSEIRLREGRPKPIDILRQNLDPAREFGMIGITKSPYTVFKGLSEEQIEDLRNDIEMHVDFDRANDTHERYWNSLLVVCDWILIGGLHIKIEADVESVLVGKSYTQLEALQSQIESNLKSGAAKVVEFWEDVLHHLPVVKAKACLDEIHAEICQKIKTETEFKTEVVNDDDDELDRSYSVQFFNEEMTKAIRAMEEGDKYPLRKPKYSNRVLTGYEWNKYNQRHFDCENPPPKMVQGYKFNVFYPDLVDKSKAPKYTIERDGDSVDTCIIRFRAGPPYEDIAFRIVNKEWENSYKKGFKSTFDGGILHLHFNFKRYSYRR